jgi:hypothetical protein
MKLFFSILASTWCCLLIATSKGEGSVHLLRSNFQDKSFVTISYTSPDHSSLRKDLKEFWKQFLFYSLLQQRLQQALPSDGVQYTCFQKGFLEQSNSCTISISCSSSQVVDVLSEVCRQVELIRKSGFSEKEFKEIKEKAYSGLYKLEDQRAVDSMTRLISNDLSNESPNVNLNVLIATSKDLIELTTLSEVGEYSRTQIIDENREIDVVVQSDESFISEAELAQILEEQKWVPEYQNLTASSHNLVKAIKADNRHPLVEEETLDEARPQFEDVSYQLISDEIKEPSVAVEVPSKDQAAAPSMSGEEKQPATVAPIVQEKQVDYYSQLPINGEEKRIISKLVVTLAENNVFKLLFEKKKLEKLGKRINHVHPMKFLGTILGDPRLFHCLREIRKSTFKWEGFMDGLVRRMNEELSHNNIEKYIPGFAAFVHKDAKQIQDYIDRRDFEGMVISFL